MKLNLGSGAMPLDGYINVDKSRSALKVDLAYDLDNIPWPFENESVDEIVMSHCLEHLKDRNSAMGEIHRILKCSGKAIISVLHFTWQLAYADPTHKHFFAYPTFYYYAGKGGYFNFKFSLCKVKIKFGKNISLWNYIIEPIANLFPTAYEQSPLRIFPALEIIATLTK